MGLFVSIKISQWGIDTIVVVKELDCKLRKCDSHTNTVGMIKTDRKKGFSAFPEIKSN